MKMMREITIFFFTRVLFVGNTFVDLPSISSAAAKPSCWGLMVIGQYLLPMLGLGFSSAKGRATLTRFSIIQQKLTAFTSALRRLGKTKTAVAR